MKFTLILINLTYLFCIYEYSTLRQSQGTRVKHQPQHIRLSSKENPPVKKYSFQMHAGIDLQPMDRLTPVKTLPSRNFVCGQ